MKILSLLLALLSFATFSQTTKRIQRKSGKSNHVVGVDFNPSIPVDSNDYFSVMDTSYFNYKLPERFEKPKNWKNQSSEKEWYGAEFSDTLKLNDVLKLIDSSNQFWDVCRAKSWCLKNYQTAFPYLVARLSIKEKIGLENTADLIIGCRVNTGDLKFYGHGGVIREDLFTAAGRGSWILNEITGESFVSVQCNMTEEESEQYKLLWLKYIEALKN